MNLAKILKSVGKFAKENPEVVLVAAGAISPKLARKAVVLAPVIIGALSKKKVG